MLDAVKNKYIFDVDILLHCVININTFKLERVKINTANMLRKTWTLYLNFQANIDEAGSRLEIRRQGEY